jgi:hypothetical protein
VNVEGFFINFAFYFRQWTCDGCSDHTPKSGVGSMVSAFTSGATGFGLPLTSEELDRVNAFREGTDYVCGEFGAPQYLYVQAGQLPSAKKFPLKSSPGIRHIYNCKAGDGYWNSHHMMVQTEDVSDAIRVVYPWVRLVLEFDHSGTHSKQKIDGLNVQTISKCFGGTQSLKRDTKMTLGCLGPFPVMRLVDGVMTDVKLKVGEIQVF